MIVNQNGLPIDDRTGVMPGMPASRPVDPLRQQEVPLERVREVQLMYDRSRDAWGVSVAGGQFVCPLPLGYGKDCGVAPFDGRLIVTSPGKPSLWADPMTGRVWVRG